jgi:hypothetical protein
LQIPTYESPVQLDYIQFTHLSTHLEDGLNVSMPYREQANLVWRTCLNQFLKTQYSANNKVGRQCRRGWLVEAVLEGRVLRGSGKCSIKIRRKIAA